MNLTLSLAINGGGGGGTTKKRKMLRDSVVDGVTMMSRDDGDRSRVMRLLQARERMMAKLEADDTSVAAAPDDGKGGLRLMHLLLSAVAAAESGDAHAAAAALHEVYRRGASFRGADPAQRVAAYFADALASSILVGRVRSPTPAPAASAAEASPPPTTPASERFLAYTMFYQASPIYQFAHFTANQAILEAFQSGGRRRLHVVDFDVSYGFQWPSLIQSLSDAAAAAAAASTTSTTTSSSGSGSSSHDGDERPVSLRITGLGTSPDELRQTEARLARFASGCPNLRFEFEGIVDDDGPDTGRRHERVIKADDDATVVVNLVFPAAAQSSTTSTREEAFSSALARVRSLNPSLVFLVEKHGGGGVGGGNATSRGRRSSLLPPFTASLRYFAAVFDSLHECLPADSAERLAIERNHLGMEISDAMGSLDNNIIYGGGDDDMADQPTSWKQRMERAGFEGVQLSSRTVSQAKLLLKMKSGCGGGGFRVVEGEGGRAMSLAWRDSTQLITATGWRRRRRSINNQAFS